MLTRVWVEDDQLVNTSSHFPPFKISLNFSESSKKNCSQLFGSPVNHLAHMSSTASSRVECSMRSYAKLISIAQTLYKHFLRQQAASDFPFFFLFLFFSPQKLPNTKQTCDFGERFVPAAVRVDLRLKNESSPEIHSHFTPRPRCDLFLCFLH